MSEALPALRNGPPAHLLCGLLAWESEAEFRGLYLSYLQSWCPVGPAEIGFVEQLVWLDWRRRRLRLGERALHMSALGRATSPERNDSLTRRALSVSDGARPELSSAGAIKGHAESDAESRTVWASLVESAETALSILEEDGKDAYAQALAAIPDSTAEWFLEASEEDDRFSQDTEGLARFLSAKVLPYFQSHLAAAEGAPTVRLQAWGESLDPFRMDKLLALDERLTRQVEKVMGMLIKLQGLRLGARPKVTNPALMAG